MAWHNFHHELTAFPTPFRGHDMHYPDFWRAHHGTPFDTFNAERTVTPGNGIEVLLDTKLERYGDLGWTLDYATAWCYRHLVGSQPEVVDVKEGRAGQEHEEARGSQPRRDRQPHEGAVGEQSAEAAPDGAGPDRRPVGCGPRLGEGGGAQGNADEKTSRTRGRYLTHIR